MILTPPRNRETNIMTTPQKREIDLMLTPTRRNNTGEFGRLGTFTTKTQVESFRKDRIKR